MVDVIKDVSTLSTIPEKDILKLLKKFVYSICSGVEEDIIKNENITAANIGIGVIYIKHDPSSSKLEYRFIPSKYLEKGLESTIKDKKNPFEDDLNNSLVKKFINVYKDLC